MKISFWLTKTVSLLLGLIFFYALGIVYLKYVSAIYGYMGFDVDVSIYKIILCIATLVFFYSIIGNSGLPAMYHHVMVAAILVPSLVLFGFSGASYEYYFATTVCCLLVILTSFVFRFKSIRLFSVKENYVLYFLAAASLIYLLGIIAQGGGKYFNLDITRVYEIRKSSAENLIPIYGYLSPVVGKVIVPLLIVISAIKGKWSFVVLGVIISIIVFGLTAHKSPLFYPVIILVIFILADKNFPVLILTGCIVVVIISFIDFYLSQRFGGFFGWFGSLFSRRALMVPALLNSYYVDFFTENPLYYWSQSKLTFGLIMQPYELASVNLIGDIYYSSPETAANAGWIGSGFANARWVGALVYSIFLGMLISTLNAIGKKIGERFVFSSSFIVVLVIFTSTDIVTSVLTHGLLCLILLLLLFSRGSMR